MTTLEVGKRLVDLCKQGKNLEALDTLYADDIVSVEAMQGTPDMPQTMIGIDAIRGKNEWWLDHHEIHSADATGPFPHGDRFAVLFDYSVTSDVGPMAGRRIEMQEVAVYSVKDGKITREEFFYDTSDGEA